MLFSLVLDTTASLSDNFLNAEIAIVALLVLSALTAIVIRYIKIPYTVALVVVGLGLTLLPNPFEQGISSDLILAVLVPPLIFEASMHIKWKKLKENLGPILLLAIVGLLAGTFLISQIIHLTLGIPLVAAIAFGALISATDPVAVIAFFRTLGVSKRLSLLVEGESLFNDGTAIVIFNLAVAAGAAAGHGGEAVGSFTDAFLVFIRVAFGGLGVGIISGYIVSYIILKNVDDHLIETSTTLALAFGSFLVAEAFHFSGILAIVSAGIMVGTIGVLNTSPTTRITMDKFWEFLAYVINSILFLLIGLTINIIELLDNWLAILIAVAAVLLSRLLLVYGLTALHARFTSKATVPMPFRHVMFWGGLRGAISLALALTLTADSFGPGIGTKIQVMTFGVVLFTLLVQGTTIERLLRKLGLSDKPQHLLQQQRLQAQLYAKQAGKAELNRMHDNGILAPQLWQALTTVYDKHIQQNEKLRLDHLHTFAELKLDILLRARQDALKAERAALSDANGRGLLDDILYHQMLTELEYRSEGLKYIIGHTADLQEDKETS